MIEKVARFESRYLQTLDMYLQMKEDVDTIDPDSDNFNPRKALHTIFKQVKKVPDSLAALDPKNDPIAGLRITVTRRAVKFADAGIDPNGEMRELITGLENANRNVAGKLLAIERFQSEIENRIKERYPETIERYHYQREGQEEDEDVD
ncbi:mediator complex, subunit Med10 [Kipferlia bialata]|uniref:Mediator of RNA polymerase II transcription subunit 10 n=1 Tax=Kipferlia bialata TaxID=797122 RepID=A0A9K3GQJ9_9EUKA|nr:mediator complex, subunit Med10 [Kipferlia bialata]|eukprot:g14020.t1